VVLTMVLIGWCGIAESGELERSPSPHEQLPRAMHGTMTERPRVTVGMKDGELVGADHRVLQAAVDYVAGLGGGTVEIGPGEFVMRDSLHLRANVTVRGQGVRTVLRKAAGSVSPLELDGDYGEEQITLKDPGGFEVGDGVAVWDRRAGGFHTTVARIVGRNGNTFAVSLPLNADCMVSEGAQAATVFPVVSGYHVEGVRVENVTIEGNKEENPHLNGCRGAGIFLFRCPGAVIVGCVVRNYNGDGISFQQSNDVEVLECVSEGNSSLGLHPGSGSQRPKVESCVARNNGEDGLFLCWRVKHGLFENNTLEGNGRFGISIGHKDTDNLLRGNRVLANGEDGIIFRNEAHGMAGHRNQLVDNLIENNGLGREAAGIRVRGQTGGLVFEGNTIRDTRPAGTERQVIGIQLEEDVGEVRMSGNRIEARTVVEDRRR
jgi:parallel beta-helix repeat protein